MKASKAVALPLLLVIMLGAMGLGFAYWNETLVIDDNVNTGELKVVMDDVFAHGPPLYVQILQRGGVWRDVGQYPLMTEDTLTIGMRNVYPGCSYGLFWLHIKNVGTIPAKIKDITIDIDDPGGMKSYVEWEQHWDLRILRADGSVVRLGRFAYTPVENVADNYYNLLKDEVLFPGDVLKFDNGEPDETCVYFRIRSDAPNDIEGCTIIFNIVFTWTQFNEP